MLVLGSLISVGLGCKGQRVYVRAPYQSLEFLENPKQKHPFYLAQACFCQFDRLGTQCQVNIMPVCKHQTDKACQLQSEECTVPTNNTLSIDLKSECRISNSELYFQGVKSLQTVKTKPLRLKQVLQVIWNYNETNLDNYLTQADIDTGQRTQDFEYFRIGQFNYSFELNKPLFLNVSLIDLSRPRYNQVLLHRILNYSQLQQETKLQVPLPQNLQPVSMFQVSVWFGNYLLSLRTLRMIFIDSQAQLQPHPVTHQSDFSKVLLGVLVVLALSLLSYSIKVCREKQIVQRVRVWIESRRRSSYQQFNQQDRSRTE